LIISEQYLSNSSSDNFLNSFSERVRGINLFFLSIIIILNIGIYLIIFSEI
jgi:hypothetical protein